MGLRPEASKVGDGLNENGPHKLTGTVLLREVALLLEPVWLYERKCGVSRGVEVEL